MPHEHSRAISRTEQQGIEMPASRSYEEATRGEEHLDEEQQSQAGVVWMAALIGILVRRVDLLSPSAFAGDSALRHAATVMLCPFLLLGNRLVIAPAAIWAAGLLSAVLLLLVWRRSEQLDIYLVDRS